MRTAFIRLLVASLVLLGGCSIGQPSAGSLRAEALGKEHVVLKGDFKEAYFSLSDGDASFMLSDVPLDQIADGQVQECRMVHIDLLWVPKPGSTPMDDSATNASIRYVIATHGEVGVYGGAGFALPSGPVDQQTLSLTIRDGSLQLLESTPGFVDLLSPAQLTGTFSAKRDDSRTQQLNQAASQLVTNALGKSRYVRLD